MLYWCRIWCSLFVIANPDSPKSFLLQLQNIYYLLSHTCALDICQMGGVWWTQGLYMQIRFQRLYRVETAHCLLYAWNISWHAWYAEKTPVLHARSELYKLLQSWHTDCASPCIVMSSPVWHVVCLQVTIGEHAFGNEGLRSLQLCRKIIWFWSEASSVSFKLYFSDTQQASLAYATIFMGCLCNRLIHWNPTSMPVYLWQVWNCTS